MAKKRIKPRPRPKARAKARSFSRTPAVENPEKVSPALIKQALSGSGGILRLAPTWVPRSFLMPGRRLKLHPADLYALGAQRGGIDERWFSSTTPAAPLPELFEWLA